ncbi:uncharacterized protein LOC115678517 [Syzygium oleosum]|uniref:uncharacterized protein LOC115678517 n=1 Tax=Syzygium oleosum TaxID=219896 RepID=UPI0024B9B9A0|nr:uncharacterized protein LOC115678517 [Syzygium oleosum]
MALSESGVADVTGVDSPPLVSRVGLHNLRIFDGVFDLALSEHLEEALFLSRFAAEMEMTTRVGGACVVVVEECNHVKVEETVGLFRKSRFVGVVNVTLIGLKMAKSIS